MEYPNVTFLNRFYKTFSRQELVENVAKCIEPITHNRKVLAVGYGRLYLDAIDAGDLFYAIPENYPLVHWPKIRPFKTVIVDDQALPFAPKSWDIIISLHQF